MTTSDPFASTHHLTPYWWETTPRPSLPPAPLPKRVDVAIVGSGYTGLNAALQIARGGRSVLVLDAEDAGWGCSTRNGGQISTSIKPGLAALAKRSLQWMGEFIAAERIDCSFGVVGRFHAAHNAAQYEKLARAIGDQPQGLEVEAHLVPRNEQHSELGTDAYHGGVVYSRHASISSTSGQRRPAGTMAERSASVAA